MYQNDDEETSVLSALPNNRKFEESLLGAMIIDPGATKRIDLTPEDFYVVRNAWIYSALKAIKTPDILLLTDYLESHNQLTDIGGQAYLYKLISETPTSLHANYYADEIRKYSKRRRAIALANKMAEIAYSGDNFEAKFAALGIEFYNLNRQAKGAAVHIKEFLMKLLNRIEEAYGHPQEVWGMETGFSQWDKILGGHHRQEVIIIAGKPGVGKSIWAYQVAEGLAKHGHHGAVYSMEMDALQVLNRQLSGETLIEANRIKSGFIEDDEWTTIITIIERMESLPIFMSDTAYWTTAGIMADVMRLQENGIPIEWVLIDYLYLLGDQGKDDNERLSMISKALKLMSRELNVNLIVISSLNKDGEDDPDPKTSALRGPAQVGFDCDMSVFLTEAKKTKDQPNDIVKVTFSKYREGDKNRVIRLARAKGIPTFREVDLSSNLPPLKDVRAKNE